MKKLIALAFVPVGEIATVFDLVAAQFNDDADDLLDYFERIWIGEPRRRGNFCHSWNIILTRWICLGADRKKPLFDHKLWNIHDRVIVAVSHSNNSVEGWHNAFANSVAISHPNILKPAEKIRREQSKFELDMAKILQGHEIKTKKACYRRLDERITRLINGFDSSELDQFLQNLAANISL